MYCCTLITMSLYIFQRFLKMWYRESHHRSHSLFNKPYLPFPINTISKLGLKPDHKYIHKVQFNKKINIILWVAYEAFKPTLHYSMDKAQQTIIPPHYSGHQILYTANCISIRQGFQQFDTVVLLNFTWWCGLFTVIY